MLTQRSREIPSGENCFLSVINDYYSSEGVLTEGAGVMIRFGMILNAAVDLQIERFSLSWQSIP